jgi:hypothetical protein
MKRRSRNNVVTPRVRRRRGIVAPGGPEETEDLEDIAEQDDEGIFIGPPGEDRSALSDTE